MQFMGAGVLTPARAPRKSWRPRLQGAGNGHRARRSRHAPQGKAAAGLNDASARPRKAANLQERVMKVTLFTRLVPVLGFACALGLAPAMATQLR